MIAFSVAILFSNIWFTCVFSVGYLIVVISKPANIEIYSLCHQVISCLIFQYGPFRYAGWRIRNGILKRWLALVECHHHIQRQSLLLLLQLAWKKELEEHHLQLQWSWHVLYVLKPGFLHSLASHARLSCSKRCFHLIEYGNFF